MMKRGRSGVNALTQHTVREAKIDFENALLKMPEAALIENEKHEIVWANDAAQQLLKVKAGEQSVIPGEITEELVKGNKNFIIKKLRIKGLTLECKSSAQKGKKSDTNIFSILSDVSELENIAAHWSKIAEENERKAVELARSNEELEQFAYVASHDLQEPLRKIKSFTELFEQHFKGKIDEKADKYIYYIVDSAARMQGLIGDLLSYSRLSSQGKTFKMTSCEKVLDFAIGNYQMAIKESNAEITHDKLPSIVADESQLIQVFQNLIGNAIKFSGEKSPRIHISAKEEYNEWIFSVQDNGIGIEAKYGERIFIIFQRLHSRQESPGSGIGLSICRKITERHGGRIWVESKPGEGSTFYFSIPKIREKSEKDVKKHEAIGS